MAKTRKAGTSARNQRIDGADQVPSPLTGNLSELLLLVVLIHELVRLLK